MADPARPPAGTPAPDPTQTLARRGVWTKGMPSPNPGGRPRGLGSRVREMVDFDQAIQTLVDIAWGKLAPASRVADRIKAIELLMDRGYGKAVAVVDVKDAGAERAGALKAMSTPKLIATVEAMRALAAGASDGDAE